MLFRSKSIHKIKSIESIAFNYDYTPYAVKRDKEIKDWCDKNKIDCIVNEDYVLHDILEDATKKSDGQPYQIFTPFKEHCQKQLKVRPVNKFHSFVFESSDILTNNNYNIKENEIDDFFKSNENIHIHGGRSNGLKILSNINKFKDYDKHRDFLTYQTTFL